MLHRLAAIGTCILLTGATGCTTEPVGRAGFPEPGTILTLGVADAPGRYSHELALDFAHRVAQATEGEIQIDVVRSDSQGPRRWNQQLARDVIDGQFHLGLVQAQAWDVLDVDTLSALFIPFLVDTDELIDAISIDPLATDLLAGLSEVGVEPLALLPGGLRHVVGDGEPLLDLEDYSGVGIRVAYSRATWAFFEALGAKPDDPNGHDAVQAFEDGRIIASDSMFRLADGFTVAPQVTGNVTPYPLAFTLVVTQEVFAGMSEQTRKALRDSAADTARWAAETRPSDAAEAAKLCERSPGSAVVLAGDAAVEELKTAAAHVEEMLREDPIVEELADRIGSLRGEVDPKQLVVACTGPPTPPPAAGADPNVPGLFPEGIYRRHITEKSLVEGGIDTATAAQHAGVWTLDLRGGVFGDPGCPDSTYRIESDRLVVELGPQGDSCGDAAGSVLFSSGWQLEGTTMTFTDVRSGHGSDLLITTLIGSEPWTKVG